MKLTYLATAALAVAASGCTREARPTSTQATPAPAGGMHGPAAGAGGHEMAAMGDVTAFVDPGSEARQPVLQAIAVLHAPDTGKQIGVVRFVDSGHQGLDVFATVEGMPPGAHAYHVHVYGDCSSRDAKSAGPHFHFTGSSLDPHVKMITGNLGELVADGEGKATHQTRIPAARIHGLYSVLGRSVVVHEKGNDPNVTPDGGAGARLACGVIGVANPKPSGTQTSAR